MLNYIDNYIKINGESSEHYGLYISHSGTYTAPRKHVQRVTVPGRNGELIIEDGSYENTPHTYKRSLIVSPENIERVRNWLESQHGYFRLEDTYHPEEFYMASYDGPFEPEVWRDGSLAKVDITFNRKPQRFLINGEYPVEFTTDGDIKNPTPFESKPLIRVYGNGTIGIGETNVIVHDIDDYVDIDSEIQDCYRGLQNLNSKVAFTRFPTLKAGHNGISLGDGITKVVITPRWYRL